MAAYTIRPRQESDYPALIEVLKRTHEADEYPRLLEHASLVFLEDPKLLQSWVAVQDGQPFGHISVSKSEADPAIALYQVLHGQQDLAAIVRLFIDPRNRGNGAARQLVETALAWAKAEGSKVVLNTEVVATASRNFYTKLGWRSFGETTLYLTIGSERKALEVICFEKD